MDRIKAANYIGIAHKAGYLIIGSDKLDGYKQKIYLIIIDNSAGSYAQRLAQKFQYKGIKVIKVDFLQELVKIPSCKICAIKNKNLSDIILNELN